MELILLSLMFAFVLGFSAHRAGICTVAAVGEVITSRSARMFLSFVKVVLWVLVINGLVLALDPASIKPYYSPGLSVSAVSGGFVFGVGAAINGGCSFSTISKIAQGDLHVALTLPAFIIGAFIFTLLPLEQQAAVIQTGLPVNSALFTVLLIALLIWAFYELFHILKPVLKNRNFVSAMNAKRYRLSTAAALIGICSSFLYLMHGRWAYSSRLIEYLSTPDPMTGRQDSSAIYLLLALLVGAAVSALLGRQFKFSFAGDKWHRNFSGGLLMGFGAMMVPGGNGKLILHDLPHLSAHAFAAYIAMVTGIAVVLSLQKSLFGKIDLVCCAGDECRIVKD